MTNLLQSVVLHVTNGSQTQRYHCKHCWLQWLISFDAKKCHWMLNVNGKFTQMIPVSFIQLFHLKKSALCSWNYTWSIFIKHRELVMTYFHVFKYFPVLDNLISQQVSQLTRRTLHPVFKIFSMEVVLGLHGKGLVAGAAEVASVFTVKVTTQFTLQFTLKWC